MSGRERHAPQEDRAMGKGARDIAIGVLTLVVVSAALHGIGVLALRMDPEAMGPDAPPVMVGFAAVLGVAVMLGLVWALGALVRAIWETRNGGDA